MTFRFSRLAVAAGFAGVLAGIPGAQAGGIDWSRVPAGDVVLFYPGQSSLEWAMTTETMSGAEDFRSKGKSCAACHIGEEAKMGPQIVTGAPRVFKTGEKPLEYWEALLSNGAPAKAQAEIVFDKRQPANSGVVAAEASKSGDGWSVTLSRPLAAGAPFSPISAGNTYHIAFAIHAGRTAHRFHYVSYERSLTLDGGRADLVANKQ